MQFHLLSISLFGISSNMDNLVVGLSYGFKKTPVGWMANLLVALVTFAGTILSMIFGKSARFIIPGNLAAFLGCAIIILIGIVGLYRYYVPNHTVQTDAAAPCSLTIREAFVLGFALSLNNIGLGIGAGITGLSILPTALCSFFFSLLFLYLGNIIGRSRLSELAGRFAEPLASILMIGLGIYELFI